MFLGYITTGMQQTRTLILAHQNWRLWLKMVTAIDSERNKTRTELCSFP